MREKFGQKGERGEKRDKKKMGIVHRRISRKVRKERDGERKRGK